MTMEGYKSGGRGGSVPDVPFWVRQIRLGLQYRKESAYEQKWPQWRNMYRGDWKGDVLPSNVFFKMVRSIVPRIYFRNPSVSITARKPGVEGFLFSKLLERTDNKLIKQMDLKNQMKKQVQSAFLFGTGMGKLGFGSQFQATPETLGTTEAPRVSRGKEAVEYNFKILANMPWYLHAPTGSYVAPAGCINFEEARWDAFVIERPLADVKADPRLKNVMDLQPSKVRFETHQVGIRMDRPVENVILFEIRDKKTGKVFIISPHMQEKVMLFEDDEFSALGISISFPLVFNEDDERCWGVPDSNILEPLQRELNEIRTQNMHHRRLSLMKLLYQRGSIDDEEIAKLLGPDVLAAVRTNTDPTTAIKTVQVADIPQALVLAENLVTADVRETLGFSRNEFGEFRPGSRSPTATEVDVVKQAADIRIDERRDMVADLLVKMVGDMNPIIFEHWKQEQVEEIVGPGGIPIWIAFRPEMLKRGQYEVLVDPDTSIPLTKDVREQKALILYDRLKTNPLIDPMKLTRYLLHELHGVAFDDMIKGIPQGMGMSPDQPMNPGQFGQLMSNVQNKFPQLVTPRQAA